MAVHANAGGDVACLGRIEGRSLRERRPAVKDRGSESLIGRRIGVAGGEVFRLPASGYRPPAQMVPSRDRTFLDSMVTETRARPRSGRTREPDGSHRRQSVGKRSFLIPVARPRPLKRR